MRRPKLKTGLTRLRRGPSSVQFGLNSDRAVVLTGVDDDLGRCLDRLDGSAPPGALAAAAGVPAQRVGALLDLLAAADLLEDAAVPPPGWGDLSLHARDRLAPDLASLLLTAPGPGGGKQVLGRRLGARVEVRGGSRIGATLAGLLSAAGVGAVLVVDEGLATPADLAPGGLGPVDLGRERGRAATRRASAAGAAAPAREPARPALVVFADELPTVGTADALVAAGVPHLVATLRETEGLIGPLVVPGRSSCLRCHDLARTDRDPAWPRLAAQLAPPVPRGGGVRPVDVALAATVAGHAALQALAYLDTGTASTIDGTLHVRLPAGTLRRRTWRRHPDCDCAWAPRCGEPDAG